MTQTVDKTSHSTVSQSTRRQDGLDKVTGRTRYAGVESMSVAVMGCVVNGPGESKHANIGISLPGTFEEPKAPVYVDGRLFTTLKGDRIVAEFIGILDEYVASHYAARGAVKEEFPGDEQANRLRDRARREPWTI